MTNIDKSCEGCRTARERVIAGQQSLCHYRPHAHTNHNCPCMTCLIKSMCNDPCEDFFKFKTMSD